MGKKKLITLAVILAVLAAAAAVKRSADDKRESALSGAVRTAEINKDLATAFVTRLSVYEASAEPSLVLLKNEAGNWTIENRYHAPARKDQIEYVLKNLTGIRGEPRSDSKEVLGDYELADGQGIRILLEGSDNKKLAETLVSPRRGSGTQNFVREAGSPAVLATDTDILSTLGVSSRESKVDVKRFVELKINSFDAALIERFELNQSGAPAMRFTKETNAETKAVSWKMEPAPRDGEVDPDKVMNLLRSMAGIYASDLQDPAGAGHGFTKPWFKAEWGPATKPEKAEIYLGAVSDKAKNKQFIKAVPPGQVYDIFTSNIDHLLKRDQASFLKSKPQT